MHLSQDSENQMESLVMLLNRKHQVMSVGFRSKKITKHPGIFNVFLRPGKWLPVNITCQSLRGDRKSGIKSRKPNVPVTFISETREASFRISP